MIKKFMSVGFIFIVIMLLMTSARIWFVYGGDMSKFKHQMEPLDAPVDLSSLTFIDRDEKSHQLSELKGKTVLITFWATWCKYCKQDMPEIARFIKDQKETGVFILPLAVPSDTTAGVRRFMERYGDGAEAYINQTPEVYKQLKIRGVPASVVVNPAGQAVATIRPKWEADLDTLLMQVK